MSEKNKALARRYPEEFWNEGKAGVFEEIVAKDAVAHVGGQDNDVEAWKQGAAMLRGAFPDFQVRIDDVMAEGDKVIQRWTLSGTNEGELFGTPATGKKVAWPAISIFRLSGGKIVEIWTQSDSLGMMQQLGTIPVPAG